MKALRAIPLLLVIIASLAACGTGAATPTPNGAPAAATPTNAPAVLPTAAQPANLCTNEYLPAKKHTRWTYSSTGSPAGPYEFTEQVSYVRSDGFTISSQLKKVPVKQLWSCRPEGLTPGTIILDNATSILAFQKLSNIKTDSETGVVIPANLVPNMQWNYTINLEGAQKAAGAVVTASMEVSYSSGNKESVAVPAGTYDAIPVTAVSLIKFDVPGSPTVIVKSQYTYWYAAGVGWVKASGNGKIGGQEFVETIVLTAFVSK